MADSGDISDEKRGPEHIPRRELAKKEIHRLITSEGLTNAQLCQRLNLPRRTLERYLHEIFNEDSLLLMRPTAQEVAMETAMLRERLMQRRQKILKIADDERVDPVVRLQAEELAIRIDTAANYKLLTTAPAIIERQMRRPDGITRAQAPVAINSPSAEALALEKKEQETNG